MSLERSFLCASILASFLCVAPGCTSEEPGKVTGPVDTSHAFKSSDEAAEAQRKMPDTLKKP